MLVAEALRRIEQGSLHSGASAALRARIHEELGSCSGREGHRRDQLGIVREPVLVVRSCPFPVKYVLSVRIGLEIHAQSAKNSLSILADQVGGGPSAPWTNAARVLECTQEF